MRFLLAVLLCCAAPAFAEETSLPLVVEAVDEICVVQVTGSDHTRIVFVRHGQILATRFMADDMVWGMADGMFQLAWQDYWMAERVIESPRLTVVELPYDPFEQPANGPWWAAWRNMRELRQP